MICVQGIGASLTRSTEALDVIDGMGESHHDSLRMTKWDMWHHNSVNEVMPAIQPWASVIQQTLSHRDVPECFQKDETMRHTIEILDEDKILQTTTCTPKDIYSNIKGWTTAFEVELFPFLTLDVKIDVHEDALDLRRVTILPEKAVMVKKPNGDGTHKKKARVVVWKLSAGSTRGRNMRQYSITSDVACPCLDGLSSWVVCSELGCVNCLSLRFTAGRTGGILPTTKCVSTFGFGSARDCLGIEDFAKSMGRRKGSEVGTTSMGYTPT